MEKDLSISKISHIHSITASFLTLKLKDLGFDNFSSSHGNILFQLSFNDSLLMSDLSDRINRDKSTTTVLVRKLEQLGFIKTRIKLNDKRARSVSLTQKGKEYIEQTDKISLELIDKFYKGFSEDEKIQFNTYLDRITNNFTDID